MRSIRPCDSRSAITCVRATDRSRPRYAGGTLSLSAASAVRDVDDSEIVALTDFVIVEIVRRRDLHAAAAEGGVDVGIADDGYEPLSQRQPHLAGRSDAGNARLPGCTATAESPNRVSGRVVATTRKPVAALQGITQVPEAALFLSETTSRSDRAVFQHGIPVDQRACRDR